MGLDDRPIIIIKRNSGGHGAHHGGAWKVAFADFMTAMMAFFLVMWILGLSSDSRKAIAAYFNDPVGFMKSVGGGSSPMSIGRDMAHGRPSVMPANGTLVADRGDGARLRLAKVALQRAVESRPEFKELRKHIEMTLTDEGLRIELLEDGRKPLFFQTGSAQLEPRTVHLLGLIGRQLMCLPNFVSIEGHTDSRPFPGGTAGYSNWELSADRANAARRVLDPVVRDGQVVEVRGLADRSLRRPEDPLHYSNRRISILVRKLKVDIGRMIEHDPAGPAPVDLLGDAPAGGSASR